MILLGLIPVLLILHSRIMSSISIEMSPKTGSPQKSVISLQLRKPGKVKPVGKARDSLKKEASLQPEDKPLLAQKLPEALTKSSNHQNRTQKKAKVTVSTHDLMRSPVSLVDKPAPVKANPAVAREEKKNEESPLEEAIVETFNDDPADAEELTPTGNEPVISAKKTDAEQITQESISEEVASPPQKENKRIMVTDRNTGSVSTSILPDKDSDLKPVSREGTGGAVQQKAVNPHYDWNKMISGFMNTIDIMDYYPVSSRRRRQQGVVVLSLVLNEQISIQNIEIARSSRYPGLDKAALGLLESNRYLLEKSFRTTGVVLQKSVQLRLPIRFVLK